MSSSKASGRRNRLSTNNSSGWQSCREKLMVEFSIQVNEVRTYKEFHRNAMIKLARNIFVHEQYITRNIS